MRYLITAKQNLFFSQNGFIEFAGPSFSLFSEIDRVLQKRDGATYNHGRDLWRDSPLLQNVLVKELKSLLFSLSSSSLRLALDQWIPKGTSFAEGGPFSKLFAVQGLVLGVILAREAHTFLPETSFGLSPFPKEEGGILFVKPHLHIDWPALLQETATDLYFAAYSLENSLYIHNPQDPLTHQLKKLGYQFGDRLNNSHHPFLSPPR
ncbi:MAG TPA: hypothetical protein VJK48_06665 [Chlamydiales bacterium]|nr:hypothetical protein [Chlamydiales bacterium]